MPAPRFPVSIKGVVFDGDRVVLLKNERDEWELPGGRLEAGEEPRACLAREIEEELAVTVAVGPILDSWIYRIAGHGEVLIVTYACGDTNGQTVRMSHEHQDVGLFTDREVEGLALPEGYRASIARARTASASGTP